jgi:hypothetical protein
MSSLGGSGEARGAAEEQARAIVRAAKKALEEQAKRGQGCSGGEQELCVLRSLERFLLKRRKTTTASVEESSSSSSPAVL